MIDDGPTPACRGDPLEDLTALLRRTTSVADPPQVPAMVTTSVPSTLTAVRAREV